MGLLQSFFGFFLIKFEYVNMFKLRSYEENYVIKQFCMFEGWNEVVSQVVLSLVFLIGTIDFSQATIIIIVSFFASVLSLFSRLSLLDRHVLMTKTSEDDNVTD